jgi:hypothetical protein
MALIAELNAAEGRAIRHQGTTKFTRSDCAPIAIPQSGNDLLRRTSIGLQFLLIGLLARQAITLTPLVRTF